jgi:NMD protein affecting ribosome stability and mRNA decay
VKPEEHSVLPRHDIHDFDDPYLPTEHLPDDTVCKGCDAVYRQQRWVRDAALRELLLSAGTPSQALCPACRKIEERSPDGVLVLRGAYWPAHRSEILHLVRNEVAQASRKNPLGSLLGIHEEDCELVIETTNAKLAQRLGRSLEKAHHGQAEYHWSEEDRLLRVEWER